MKLRDGQTKWALLQGLSRRVPQVLIEQLKLGFGAPIGSWLRGLFYEWAEHLIGQLSLKYQLWDMLMSQAFLEHQQKV